MGVDTNTSPPPNALLSDAPSSDSPLADAPSSNSYLVVVDDAPATTSAASDADEPTPAAVGSAVRSIHTKDLRSDVTLPPSQTFWKSTLGGRNVMLSVNESGLFVGQGTSYAKFDAAGGTFIWAESLVLSSSISSTNGLTIAAHTLLSTSGQNATISTAGEDGKPQQELTTEEATNDHPKKTQVIASADGQSAGPLNVYLERGTDQNAEQLSYLASGGAGGYVIFAGSQAGKGGNGGKIVRIFRSVYYYLFIAFDIFLSREDVVSGSQDTPVDSSSALFNEAYGPLRISRDYMSQEVESLVVEFETMLGDIKKGRGKGPTLRQLATAARRVRNALVQSTDRQSAHSFASAVNFSGGYGGSGLHVIGVAGKQGTNGSSKSLLLPQHDSLNKPLDNEKLLKQMPFAFAHPRQCSMLLTRANTYYYMGSPSLLKQAIGMYQRLMDRLSFLPLKDEDPLFQAYKSDPIMPYNSPELLQGIRDEAGAKLAQLMSGCVSLGIGHLL